MAQESEARVLEMIAAAAPLTVTLHELMRVVEQRSNGMLCSVLLISEDQKHLRHGAAPSLPESYNRAIDGIAIGPCAGSCGTAAFLGRPVIVTDIATDPLWTDYAEVALAAGLRACWAVPIRGQRGQLIGTLAMYYRSPASPSSFHQVMLAKATHLASIAIERDLLRRERDKLLDQLSSDHQRLAAILDQLPAGVVVADRDGRLILGNRQVESILGHPLIPSGSVDEYQEWGACHLDGSPYDSHDLPLARSLEQGQKVAGEDILMPRADGTSIFMSVSSAPIRDKEGSLAGAVIVFSDISERRQSEAEMERLVGELKMAVRTRDDFLSIASHELRTPLTSLQLRIESLMEELSSSGEGPRERLVLAMKQIKKLERLNTELLDVARLDSGKFPLQLEDVELTELAREVAERFRSEFARKDTELTLETSVPVHGRWDRTRLDQVITNLLSNALTYGLCKPVVLAVRADEKRAVLEVRDRGMGIAPGDQERIFERFERGVSTRHYGGLGLGLWISRQIVNALGGTIRVHSEPEAGSTFIVELPLTTDDAGAAAQ
jgi:signal transduction histidine kinase